MAAERLASVGRNELAAAAVFLGMICARFRDIQQIVASAMQFFKAPASSTPVAPPPMTTKVSQSARLAGSVSRSACS